MKEKVKSNIVIDIENRINNIFDKKNIELVDIDITFGKSNHITIFIYNKNKTDLDELSKITKKINPVIENIPCFNKSFILEISSPGIYRKFKYKKEFNIFRGKEIKIVTDKGEVFKGISDGLKENEVFLKIKNNIMKFNINKIKNAYLNG